MNIKRNHQTSKTLHITISNQTVNEHGKRECVKVKNKNLFHFVTNRVMTRVGKGK